MPSKINSRNITVSVQRILWAKAAGRCEFSGCNKPLWKSSVTQEQVNIAQQAHIYSFSDDGPRGNEDTPSEQLNDLCNIMLVCHECHQKIDNEKDGGRYTAELLRAMKTDHESRIELITSIDPDKKSHVLLYGANIGSHSSPLSFNTTAKALFPERYPAEDKAIELGMADSVLKDQDDIFWQIEENNLIKKFNQRVRERLADGSIRHISIFALAPQSLLIKLGSLMTDILAAEVFQLHREPQGWGWLEHKTDAKYFVQEPKEITKQPALILSLSATITEDRIKSVLGDEVSIWEISIESPNNDFLKSRKQLQDFRILARKLMDKIKAVHGQDTILHVFPAVPVSISVELGRIRMPKADLLWKLYDQVNERKDFIHAIDIV
jgi:hypothetical protein